MLNLSTEKQQLKSFMSYNFKWSSKNFKVSLNDITSNHRNQSQSLKKTYKSYRLNKLENASHFSSYTKNIKEERVDMATQIAELQTQIIKKTALRLKDRDIIVNIMNFLTSIFKNVPSFHYLMDYLDRYIFLDPIEHQNEIFIMKQKCGFYEDVKVSFKELFDNIDALLGDSHDSLKRKYDDLKQLNIQLNDRVFNLETTNDYLKKKISGQKKKFKYVTSLQKEKSDILQNCLTAKFELITAKNTIKTMTRENRALRVIDEEYGFYKIDNDKKTKTYLLKSAKLREEIKKFEADKTNRLNKQELLKNMIDNCNQEFNSYHTSLKDCLNNIRNAKTLDTSTGKSTQKRFSSIVVQALQAKNLLESMTKQTNTYSRRNTKVINHLMSEMQIIEGQISPDNKIPLINESGMYKWSSTLANETIKTVNDRESFFISSQFNHSYIENNWNAILNDCYEYLAQNVVDSNLKGLAFDLFKLFSVRFKNVQKKFIEYLLAFKCLIDV